MLPPGTVKFGTILFAHAFPDGVFWFWHLKRVSEVVKYHYKKKEDILKVRGK